MMYLVPGSGILGRAGGWTGGEEEGEEEEGKGPGAEPIASVEEGPHWPSAQEESVWKLCGRLAPDASTTERTWKRERHG